MPRLILCEKSSVARAVAIGLGVSMSGGLPYRDDEWVIAAARGHLLEGAEPEDYDPALARWTRDSLPILPERFQWKPRGEATLLDELVELLHDPAVTGVVNACDAGREGELIFKLIYRHATEGPSGRDPGEIPVERAWFSSLTPGAVRRAFEALRSNEEVRGLEYAAILRDTGDWMVGINGTRAATLAAHPDRAPDEKGAVVSLGRVQTPTLRILVEREREIDQYLPIPFYRVRAVLRGGLPVAVVEGEGAELMSVAAQPGPHPPRALRAFETREEAEGVARVLEEGEARFLYHVAEVLDRAAPLPFDLATLQVEASRAFGWTADRTLRRAQELYEKQYLSYPRTDSRFLTWDLKGQVLDAFQVAATLLPEVASVVEELSRQAESDTLSGRPFNAARVRDHHAIIPTGKRVAEDAALGEDERRLLLLVARRTVAAFLPPFRTEEHRVGADMATAETSSPGDARVASLATGPIPLEGRARRVLDIGWRAVEGGPLPEVEDPHLAALEALAHAGPGALLGKASAVEVEERNPRRPRAHTDGTLIRAMERAGDEVAFVGEVSGTPAPEPDSDPLEDDEGEPHVGIGTPATRASIVETLLRRQYAVRDGTAIHATARGVRLIEAIEGMELADPRLTAQWEHRMAAVEEGREDPQAFEGDLRALTRRTVEEIFRRNLQTLGGPPREVGPCPWCGGTIVERDKAYGCNSWKGAEAPGCGWVVFRNTRYGRIGMAEARWRQEHDRPTVGAGNVTFPAGSAEPRPELGVRGYRAYEVPLTVPDLSGGAVGPGGDGRAAPRPLAGGESPEELVAWDEAILAVVAAEGPVMVRRILAALETRAQAGGMRGNAPRRAVNRRTAALVREGKLLEVPDGRTPRGQLDKVLRLPVQEEVVVRARGPRDLLEIPHQELRALERLLHRGQGDPDPDEVARVLDLPEVVHTERQEWIDAALGRAEVAGAEVEGVAEEN